MVCMFINFGIFDVWRRNRCKWLISKAVLWHFLFLSLTIIIIGIFSWLGIIINFWRIEILFCFLFRNKHYLGLNQFKCLDIKYVASRTKRFWIIVNNQGILYWEENDVSDFEFSLVAFFYSFLRLPIIIGKILFWLVIIINKFLTHLDFVFPFLFRNKHYLTLNQFTCLDI